MGYASSELIDADEMEALVYRAASNARYVEADDGGVIFAGSPKYEKINAPEPKVLDAGHIKSMALSIQKESETSDKDNAIICFLRFFLFKASNLFYLKPPPWGRWHGTAVTEGVALNFGRSSTQP